ncbi:hypothetical protein GQ602_003583 [Ophiocordyceps camponoti-floridani]|uniref:Uncharacterized protein n=1 Tax=Ophiocordyceps camponoti-floridani TaxID=2030778 RepID=A0A8H4VEE4_9HYPO|nr:hypothetical protein GQ602_003583 [Ophiocordyceps camponoti-floridani]
MKWAALTALFPELMLSHAILEFTMAIDVMNLALDIIKPKTKRNKPWTLLLALRRLMPMFIVMLNAIPETMLEAMGCCSKKRKDQPRETELDPIKIPWWFNLGRGTPSYHETPFESPALPSSPNRPRTCTTPTEHIGSEQWTMTHCYFANMGGGFHLKLDEGEGEVEMNKTKRDMSRKEEAGDDAEKTAEEEFPPILTGHHLAAYLDVIDLRVSQEHIKDKSKRDYFAKGIAMLQLGQLFISAIVRLRNGWAFSQLEMITLALAGYGFLTNIAYWYKPQDVAVPFEVGLHKGRKRSWELKYRLEERTYGRGWYALSQKRNRQASAPRRIPDDNIPLLTVRVPLIVALLTVILGGFHVIA